ncbi:MAG: E2F family transcription factor [archaeon]|nr:E2F family transcription factor [archaeon]
MKHPPKNKKIKKKVSKGDKINSGLKTPKNGKGEDETESDNSEEYEQNSEEEQGSSQGEYKYYSTPVKIKKNSRQENSLGELTKNFINYVRESGKSTININDLVKKLKVKKRRIYDITNVLEGIGYIKKHQSKFLLFLLINLRK